ncbi:ATP-binding protein [Streptomyces sp. NPDC002078]
MALPAEPTSVGLVRHWAVGVLTLWGLSADDRSTAALIISELAANAALYGHSEMTIRLAQRRDQLRMCLTDSGAWSAQQILSPRELAEHGRGLAIVQALADSTEVTREPGGWRVGAVLRVRRAEPGGGGFAAHMRTWLPGGSW